MFGRKLWRRAALVGAALPLTLAAPGVAQAAVIDPGPIGAQQFFTGLVNGVAGESRIVVICDGPADVVPLGHPVAGQTVRAEQLPSGTTTGAGEGFTGSAARALEVRLGTGNTTPVTLRFYHASMAIPTTALVPCGGSGTVTFTPNPGSPTAVTGTVTVTFVSQS